ncbi:putative protein OS=Streptomyces aurantiogriseus OX=66870 GN=GCM10010251_14960 PE=4 SV=1 [Streptomyces aurantiogriseus]|uniref:Uncharacterized protein n=1 Tax=Streptomyces aurantiogriseus TaxID=66870 RepID=A0A918F4H6_9ACTN|nr:hypothetical protein GCM10010251_14960 [Streptomyces aurantiogriseus]
MATLGGIRPDDPRRHQPAPLRSGFVFPHRDGMLALNSYNDPQNTRVVRLGDGDPGVAFATETVPRLNETGPRDNSVIARPNALLVLGGAARATPSGR